MLQQRGRSTFEFCPPADIPQERLLHMADAGVKIVDCIRRLHEAGSNLINEAQRGCGDFTEWEHYPPDDVHDPRSHAQYYFHAHPPDERDAPDFGHFHTFMRSAGMSGRSNDPAWRDMGASAPENSAPTHLIAISMTASGMPERLFTTNRWVTGEAWHESGDVIRALDHFAIDLDHPSRLLNDWLTAMFVLFRPQIEMLLIERDRTIECRKALHPNYDVLEDRRLEIPSSVEISLCDQIAWLDRRLESIPASPSSTAA